MREAMLTHDRMILLTADMRACLEWESQQRGIGIAELCEEELYYRRLARQKALSREELKMLVETSTGNERLSEDDEESPF